MKRIVLTLALVLVVMVTGLATAKEASAATSISGTVTANGYRQPGVDIHVYRAAAGGAWQSLGRMGRTDSLGRYNVGGLSNWFYYQVLAHGVYGQCFIGVPPTIWQGWSQVLWATGGPRGANIYMSYVTTVAC